MKMDIVYSLQAQQESSYPTELKNIDTWPSDRVANYTGSDRKEGVIGPNGRRYLIKYAQKHTGKDDMDTSDVNNAMVMPRSTVIFPIIFGLIGLTSCSPILFYLMKFVRSGVSCGGSGTSLLPTSLHLRK